MKKKKENLKSLTACLRRHRKTFRKLDAWGNKVESKGGGEERGGEVGGGSRLNSFKEVLREPTPAFIFCKY